MNRSCWNDHPAPILDNSSVGCPFKEPPSVFEDSDSLSSKQIFYRVVVFLVLEHFQLFIIKLVGRVRLRHMTSQAHQPLAHETSLCRQWNKNKAKKQAADWELETRRQHQLMAEELFPAHASEQVHAIQLGKKFGGRWLKKARKSMETKSRSLRTRASQRFLGSSKDLSKSMTGSGDGESGPASPKKSPDKKGHASLTKSVQSPRTPPDDDDDPGAMLTRQRSSSNRKISFKADDGADDGALARQSPRSPPSSSSTGDDGGGLARTSSKSSLVSSRSSSMRGAQTPPPPSPNPPG